MTVARSVSDVLEEHVTLEVECIDRMYLNLYVSLLQTEGGIAHYFRKQLGYDFASTALMTPMTERFVRSIKAFAEREHIDVVKFHKKQRKEDIAKAYLRKFELDEGVLFIGKAQEKTRTPSTRRRHNPQTGKSYPDLYMTTRMVNQYYFYCVDEDFGPFFLKLGSYFPYTGRLCINGHEFAKRQLAKRGIAFKALDNGIEWCEDPEALKVICESLDAEKIRGLVHKWFERLPHPFTDEDRPEHGYNISMLQSEFSLTQVLDRPLSGRVFFEQVIRDNLDIGRPDRVQLIFDRRVTKRTPGTFRTRVITDGVIPSLHINYKRTRIKQYFKEGRALRTETTINNTVDFKIGKLVHNLPALKEVGFAANRRLLDVQRISHDSTLGDDTFAKVNEPVVTDEGRRAAGLRFGDPRVLALLTAILFFNLLPRGFSNKDLRGRMAQLLGLEPGHFTQGKMTYDLRRLRLHGLIERIPKTHRYRVTDLGLRAALLITRTYNCVLRPGLAAANDPNPPALTRLGRAVDRVDLEVTKLWETGRVAA